MTGAIEQFLADEAGLNLEVFGSEAVKRAVAVRMESCDKCDLQTYLDLLRRSREERNELIEQLAILETWFFRDGGPFDFLEAYARNRRDLRVLSAPCATGEEPYSIAIALIEAGLPPGAFHIDACDISRSALEQASRAQYDARSFRGDWRGCRSRWLEPAGHLFSVRPEVTAAVKFHRDDLLHPVFLASQAPYDVIFCRNLLIYLLPEAQVSLIETIGRLLCSGGVVIAGHAEVGTLLRQGYGALPGPASFACRKKHPPEVSSALRQPVRQEIAPAARTPLSASRSRHRAPTLDKAQQLADKGAFDEAWSLCEELLLEGPDAAAYYLEGLISAARNRLAHAEECFQKAIYLDPSHYEALVQMSLLCERAAEPDRGRLFRERAARLASERTELSDARRY